MKELLTKTSKYQYEIKKQKDMNSSAKIFISEELLKNLEKTTIQQLINVTKLPGIQDPVVAMPDVHMGYGLPVGSVAAFSEDNGIISAGMVGFDINCGINLIKTNLTYKDIKPKIKQISEEIFKRVPSGVGSKGKLKLTKNQLDEILTEGGKWCLEQGYANENDIKNQEETSRMENANIEQVSELAKKRGLNQIGTLGSGNHFLEIQKITEKYNKKFFQDQITFMIHTGSRGLGHQVATDHLKIQEKAAKKYNIKLPDKQLAYSPINSKEGENYFNAMKAAANFAFANRLIITNAIREALKKVYPTGYEKIELNTYYGLAHNICKKEKHNNKQLYIHRKGATRSFPNTPVLVAGSMGTSSYILEGTEQAMKQSYGSSCHGSGRLLSRTKALKDFSSSKIKEELEKQGKIILSSSQRTIAEEAPNAYKDVDEVIKVIEKLGISKKITKNTPISVIKG